MRIIAGELKGRAIEAPEGRGTRPMLDRVREAIFSTLAPWLEGALVLDLFAGSGSLSLEALSRGARAARVIERDRRALAVLERNVASLGLDDRVEVVRDDALAPASWGDVAADVVFLDPPYPWLQERERRGAIFTAVGTLLERGLAADGVIVFHAPRGEVRPREFGPAAATSERNYGSNAIWYVGRNDDE